jgi:hypothetical protein
MDAATEPAGTNPGFKPKSNQEGGILPPIFFLQPNYFKNFVFAGIDPDRLT